ncbi:MAG: hypothetical protein IKU09_06575 [Firmicutes bacterium]|nr:hypothetical protein [Bacillota bacterium]
MIYLLFAWNLVLTVAVEGAVMGMLFRRRDYMYYSMLANVITNPAVNLLLFFCVGNLGWSYWPVLGVLEMAALAAEAYIYSKICDFGSGCRGLLTATGVSVFLNLLSWGTGYVINNLVF